MRGLAYEAGWSLPALILLGWAGGLTHWSPQWDDQIARLALVAILAPAIGEELLFRVAMLPKPTTDKPLPLRAVAAATALFVLWHPVQILVFGRGWGETVLNPWFLTAVAVFGVASARLYWRSASIWPSAFFHWLVVVGWKALLDGPSPWISSPPAA